MTRAERALAPRWRWIALLCWLTALSGGVVIGWAQHQRDVRHVDQLAEESDLRGTAVSTLTGDVRALRAQVQAVGGTPVAPDPAAAVPHLPDRTAVPVPIHGPPGQPGAAGAPGQQGAPGVPGVSGSPGPTGAAGTQGVPGGDGAPGRDGVDGQDGAPGRDGAPGPAGEQGPAGPAGPSCPTGYSLQPAVGDPYAVVCRSDDAPPSQEPTSPTSPPAVVSDRRRG